jgi:hypothetical protein
MKIVNYGAILCAFLVGACSDECQAPGRDGGGGGGYGGALRCIENTTVFCTTHASCESMHGPGWTCEDEQRCCPPGTAIP